MAPSGPAPATERKKRPRSPLAVVVANPSAIRRGLLPVRLPTATVETLMRQLLDQRGAQLTIDLPNQTVTGPDGKIYPFEIEPLSKRRLIRGLDEIAHTQEYSDAIRRFEDDQKKSFPWLYS